MDHFLKFIGYFIFINIDYFIYLLKFIFRGAYRNMPCAIKLVFTSDLTEEVILRAEAEATLLSSIKSLNIVNILGVSVLPPR